MVPVFKVNRAHGYCFVGANAASILVAVCIRPFTHHPCVSPTEPLCVPSQCNERLPSYGEIASSIWNSGPWGSHVRLCLTPVACRVRCVTSRFFTGSQVSLWVPLAGSARQQPYSENWLNSQAKQVRQSSQGNDIPLCAHTLEQQKRQRNPTMVNGSDGATARRCGSSGMHQQNDLWPATLERTGYLAIISPLFSHDR